MAMPITQTAEKVQKQELSTHLVRHVVKRTTPQRITILEPMQQINSLLETEDQQNKIKINRETQRSIQLKVSGCRPGFKVKTPRLRSGTACDRPETAKTTGLSPIPVVVWQQPLETPVHHHKLEDNHNGSANNTNETTQEFENKQVPDVASQTSPPKAFRFLKSRTATEQFREKSGNE